MADAVPVRPPFPPEVWNADTTLPLPLTGTRIAVAVWRDGATIATVEARMGRWVWAVTGALYPVDLVGPWAWLAFPADDAARAEVKPATAFRGGKAPQGV